VSRTLRVPIQRVEAVTVANLPDDTYGCLVRLRAHASVLEVLMPVAELERLVNGAAGVIPAVKTARRHADN